MAGVILAFCPRASADVPVAEIEGDINTDLRELITAVVGDAQAAPRSLAQARRRTQTAGEAARSALRSQGYYGARVEGRIDEAFSESDSEKKLPPQPVLKITPGPQFQFSTIAIVYEDAEPDIAADVRKSLTLKPGQAAIAAKVVESELRAVNIMRAKGYPEAASRPRKAVVDHDLKTLSVTYNIYAGDKTVFGEIEQIGTAYLVKSWPKMIAPFKPGDVFDDRKLNSLAARVVGTGVFDGASAILADEKTPNSDGTVTRDVKLNIEQGAINTVSGGIGYSTTDGSGVDVTYERRNFVGYAQTLKLLATVKTNEISAGAEYNIPFAWRADRELDFGASIAREDTEAFVGERAGVNVLMTQKFAPHLTVSGGLSLETSQFEENGVDIRADLVEGLLKSKYDTRNSLFDPEKGINIEADITPTYNFGKADGYYTNAELTVSTYKRISDKLIAAVRVKGGTIFGANQASVPLNRRYYSGGGGSVRGFGYQTISPQNANNELIGGRSVAELGAEIRYRGKESNIGYVGFVDAGSVSPEDLPTLSDVRYGAGVGVRYYTSFAPLRADIAIPLNKRDGDDDFQLYLSIGQAF